MILLEIMGGLVVAVAIMLGIKTAVEWFITVNRRIEDGNHTEAPDDADAIQSDTHIPARSKHHEDR